MEDVSGVLVFVGVSTTLIIIAQLLSIHKRDKYVFKIKASDADVHSYDLVIDTRSDDDFLNSHLVSHNYIHLCDLDSNIRKIDNINLPVLTKCLLIGGKTSNVVKRLKKTCRSIHIVEKWP